MFNLIVDPTVVIKIERGAPLRLSHSRAPFATCLRFFQCALPLLMLGAAPCPFDHYGLKMDGARFRSRIIWVLESVSRT